MPYKEFSRHLREFCKGHKNSEYDTLTSTEYGGKHYAACVIEKGKTKLEIALSCDISTDECIMMAKVYHNNKEKGPTAFIDRIDKITHKTQSDQNFVHLKARNIQSTLEIMADDRGVTVIAPDRVVKDRITSSFGE